MAIFNKEYIDGLNESVFDQMVDKYNEAIEKREIMDSLVEKEMKRREKAEAQKKKRDQDDGKMKGPKKESKKEPVKESTAIFNESYTNILILENELKNPSEKKNDSGLNIFKILWFIIKLLVCIPYTLIEIFIIDKKSESDTKKLKKLLDENPEIKRYIVSIAKETQKEFSSSLKLDNKFKKYYKNSSISEAKIECSGNTAYIDIGYIDTKSIKKDTGLTNDTEFDDWEKSVGSWVEDGEKEIKRVAKAMNNNFKKHDELKFLSIDCDSFVYGLGQYYEYDSEPVCLNIDVYSMMKLAKNLKSKKENN